MKSGEGLFFFKLTIVTLIFSKFENIFHFSNGHFLDQLSNFERKNNF